MVTKRDKARAMRGKIGVLGGKSNSQHWKNYLLLSSDTDSKIQKYKYNYRHVLDSFQVLVATQLAMMS
ncbi:hypothetical protein OUZ56_013056 [Daphnia magna]|uniref:Uncharacterized protein n=1 Tax=Daphnia magna TaxID=35525 RepID=A0ABQ9Z4R6_9CRUS|nr:hypothetical protein OUZ56_013056 [Daphnia magna]